MIAEWALWQKYEATAPKSATCEIVDIKYFTLE